MLHGTRRRPAQGQFTLARHKAPLPRERGWGEGRTGNDPPSGRFPAPGPSPGIGENAGEHPVPGQREMGLPRDLGAIDIRTTAPNRAAT